jgi:hypothetical protein
MTLCIFCDNDLADGTKPEHILLNALGGRKTTTSVDCSTCNERFGGTIDAAFAEQVAVLRNHLQLESGSGGAPPGLGRQQAGNETIKIKSDGTPELVTKPFVVTSLGGGQFNLQITARSPEEIESYIPHIAAQMRTTEEAVRAQLRAAQATIVSRRPGVIHFHVPLGGIYECKSLLKSCLVLWAIHVGNDELRSPAYAAARAHVNDLDRATAAVNPPLTIRIDSRPVPQLERLKAGYDEFFNLIYIRSDANGRVIAHFTLYNIISWQLVLAEAGGTPNLKTALVSNPLHPVDWSDSIADEIDIDTAWLNSPDFEVSRARDRLTAAIVKSQRDGSEREIRRITDAVFLKHGLLPDTPLSDPEQLKSIMSDITTRIAHHIVNVPHEEVVTGESVLGKTVVGGPNSWICKDADSDGPMP